jgi:dienelactone hydrolase
MRGIIHFCLAAVLVSAATVAAAQNVPFARMEIHPVQSVTLTGDQFLTGDRNGKPVTLAGELRLPKPGTDKLPAIILVHGSGGLSASPDAWAREFNAIGVAAFILDSFAGRGIVSTVNDQSQLNSLAMMVDAYRALAILAEHPRIDRDRIAVIGFSKGAVASVYSSNRRFRELYGPPGVEFSAHVGLYTPCNVAYDEDDRTTGKPVRLHHGIADDYVAIAPCRDYVARLKQAGADVALAEYPDAHHAYDNPVYTTPLKIPTGQTTRNCLLKEAAKGVILNAKSGQPYDIATDPCVEKGPQIAYNATAHQATVAGVKDFLKATFKLN